MARRPSNYEDPLATKNPTFNYMTNKSFIGQLAKESIITKWAAWISGAQLCGYLLSILGWIMCITSTAAEQWRIWHVENVAGIPSGVVWVGIWRVCYMYGTDSEGIFFHCEDFTEDFSLLPKEIFLAQDLMSLACVVGAVAICFMTFALWNVFKIITHKTFLITFFNLAGILNLTSGALILIPVSWNLYSVLVKAGIMFPEFFKLPVFPKDQHVGAAIYVGFVAAALFLLSGFLILCNKYFFQKNEIHLSPLANEPMTAEVSSELCAVCGSAMALKVQNSILTESSADDASSVNTEDPNKLSSKSIQIHHSENTKSHPIILVTPCK